jgi:hypothetical protein
MQQAGAVRDAVELHNVVDILEAPNHYLEPTVGAGQRRQLADASNAGTRKPASASAFASRPEPHPASRM